MGLDQVCLNIMQLAFTGRNPAQLTKNPEKIFFEALFLFNCFNRPAFGCSCPAETA